MKSMIKPSLGIWTTTGLVIANMIGAGIFTTSGIMASYLPNGITVLFCWLWGGLIALSGALCYSELSTSMPENGGEYIYLSKLYHPVLGFLSGWTSLIVGFSAPIALSGKAFSEYFLKGINCYNSENSILTNSLAIGVIFIFSAIHYFGTKKGVIIQNILSYLKVIMIITLAVAGLVVGGGDVSLTLDSTTKLSILPMGTVMVMVMFSYSGWNAASYITEEVKNIKRNLPLSLIIGTSTVIILYLLINIFIFKSVPFKNIQGEIAVIKLASDFAFGFFPGKLFSIIIALILLSSISAFIIIGPRVYHAMSKNGHFPSFAGEIHKKHKVPSKAILIQCIISIMMVIVGSIEQLLIYIGFALWLFPLLSVIGLMIFKNKLQKNKERVKTLGYPITPLFFIVNTICLMGFAFANKPLESSVAIITVCLGIPVYLGWRKYVSI